jgi:hypothetical protein
MIFKYFIFILSLSILTIACKTAKNATDLANEKLLLESKRDIKAIPVLLELDELGNIYVVNDKNVLSLYDKNKVKKFEYANNRLGKITSIDVSNALNPMIFYKDFGHIIVLDNSLALVKDVNLSSNGKMLNAGPIAMSNDKNYWIFDPQIQKIVKVNDLHKKIAESNHFNDLNLMGKTPHKMIEEGNFLIVLIKGEGFLVFDNFGQYIRTLIQPQALDFQFDGKTVYFKTMTGIKSQGINSPDHSMIGLPKSVAVENAKIIRLSKDIFVTAYADGVDVVVNELKK